ncbi:penicillin acylase family protein [Jiulongibacter sp. NS-SX5]|uniref:penicillin acylase family protein n=1 Tax=Jiulongibacter sp. NS-SX5 TaxID=3463854 RepID=UPI004058BC88
MRILKAIWPTALLVVLLYLLGNSFGTIPPIGKLFSPFTGFWQNTKTKDLDDLKLPGLKDEIEIKIDKNRVPHIFANNNQDLYYAQGYLLAKDRLWQMEFYTLVSSGRLTEVVGDRALEYDRYNRRSGMAKAAEEIIARLDEAPTVKQELEAYAAGVNDYINSLHEKDLPIEYKILNYRPEPWSPLKTMLMFMNMRNQLNGGSSDLRMTKIAEEYGMEVVNDLFPNYPDRPHPIIPEGTSWNFEPLKIPEMPEIIMAGLKDEFSWPEQKSEIGSNNWAVSGEKSASGLPLLSNDPHLGLTLPSIWYQAQLVSPDVNVYGACLPGVPGVIIGFNKDIAWGVTNTGPDVLDFYKIKFNDASKSQYFHDGEWKDVTRRIENYTLKTGEVISDTVLFTHHGPVIYEEASKDNFNQNVPAGYAMRWIAHDNTPTDLLCFRSLNRAKNYTDYRKALLHYNAPAQNFIFASNENDIAITPNGKFPLKWNSQGKFLLDGTRADHDWQGFIPHEHNPTVKNPERGFVSSANQFLTDQTYPYYIDHQYADTYRGAQINRRLTAMQNATIDSLRSVQNDNYSIMAEWFLPQLLPFINSEEGLKSAALKELRLWDYRNDAEKVAPAIFETWHNVFMKMVWDDEFPEQDQMTYPTDDRTLTLIQENQDSPYFDNILTKNKIESLSDIVQLSFEKTIDSLSNSYGSDISQWNWWKVKKTGVRHLVPAFEAFSVLDIEAGGGKTIVNATQDRWGPSWRMVVQLDKDWPIAYGLYPGGQSGNPGSEYYKNMIEPWRKGELFPLVYLKNSQENHPEIFETIKISPKK